MCGAFAQYSAINAAKLVSVFFFFLQALVTFNYLQFSLCKLLQRLYIVWCACNVGARQIFDENVLSNVWVIEEKALLGPLFQREVFRTFSFVIKEPSAA